MYAAAGVRFADGFVGLSLCGGGYSARQLADAVRAQLKGGALSCEVMVHPGRANQGRLRRRRPPRGRAAHAVPRARAALDGVARLAPPPEAARYEAGGGAEEAVRLRCGDVELRLLAPPPVHLDPLNSRCSRRSPTRSSRATACSTTPARPHRPRPPPRRRPRFADVDEGAVRAAAANAAAAGYERGRQ